MDQLHWVGSIERMNESSPFLTPFLGEWKEGREGEMKIERRNERKREGEGRNERKRVWGREGVNLTKTSLPLPLFQSFHRLLLLTMIAAESEHFLSHSLTSTVSRAEREGERGKRKDRERQRGSGGRENFNHSCCHDHE